MDDAAFDAALRRLADAHPRQEDFDALCLLYEEAAPAQRERLRGAVDVHDGSWDHPLVYVSFREPERHLPLARAVRCRLIGYCIAGEGGDWRDTLVMLAHLWNTAESAGLNPDPIFRAVARMAGETEARLILNIAGREPKDRGRRAFCLEEAVDETGTYLRVAPPAFV